jgi:hypothetical protein
VKSFTLILILFLSFSGTAGAEDGMQAMASAAMTSPAMPKDSLSPFQESLAYKQYQKRSRSELAKLFYLIERLRMSSLHMIYNGKTYQANQIATLVKGYVVMNYKKESAKDWIQKNAYKSCSKGEIIYIQYPSGSRCLLRDVLLEELRYISEE